MEVRQLLRNPFYMPYLSRQARLINGRMITRLVLVSNKELIPTDCIEVKGAQSVTASYFVNISNYAPFSAIEINVKE